MKHPDRNPIHIVEKLRFRDSVLQVCTTRNDEWAEQVKRRVLDCLDLVAAEGRYHKICLDKFYLSTGINQVKPGRPLESESLKHLNLVCEWLEGEAELYSLSEIFDKMADIANGGNVYGKKWLKQKLKLRYKDNIFFSEIDGKSDVICFRHNANYLINEAWYSRKRSTPEEEAEEIIRMAGKLILGNIRGSEFDREFYPCNKIIEFVEGLKWLPPYLRILITSVIKQPLKQVGIGQSIVNAARPKSVISRILFGLGIELDHVFGSKWLLKELNRLGFCIGSDEVTRYKQSIVENENAMDFLCENLSGSFTQWPADNADHNLCTLDGKGTFHAMGIIASRTGTNEIHAENGLYKAKRQKRKIMGQVIKNMGIPIYTYIPEEVYGMSKLYFKNVLQLQSPHFLPLDKTLDLFWHTSLFFRGKSCPGWSGFMTDISVGDYPGKSYVNFLPIIDLDPTDMTSTLLFVIDQSEKLRIQTPVITFDQPLWLKATEIVSAKSLHIVLVLGRFHLMMSFAGSIGSLVKGSGLKEALQNVYAENTVEHILSGKAIARALPHRICIDDEASEKIYPV